MLAGSDSGVSSAHAVPAYAGIPVTQRGVAAQVTFVTGHEDPTRPESAIDWASLAATPGTLVFLMGVGALEENARRLIAHGMRADTPAAVISHGTQSDQRTVTAPLARIADAAAELPAPARSRSFVSTWPGSSGAPSTDCGSSSPGRGRRRAACAHGWRSSAPP